MLTKTNKFRDYLKGIKMIREIIIKNFDSKEIIWYHISVMSDQYYLVTTCLAAYHFFNIIYYLIEIYGLVFTLL